MRLAGARMARAYPLGPAGTGGKVKKHTTRMPESYTNLVILWTIHAGHRCPCAWKHPPQGHAASLHPFMLAQGSTSEPLLLSLTIYAILKHFSFRAFLRIRPARPRFRAAWPVGDARNERCAPCLPPTRRNKARISREGWAAAAWARQRPRGWKRRALPKAGPPRAGFDKSIPQKMSCK